MKNFNGAYIRCDLGIRKVLSAIPLTNPPTVLSDYIVTVDGGSIPIEFKASYSSLLAVIAEPVPGVTLLGKPVIVCDENGYDFNNLQEVLASAKRDYEDGLKSEVFVVTSDSYHKLVSKNEVYISNPDNKPTEVRINKATDMYSTFMLGFLANSIDL